jgi:uncharacterized membrane protein
MIALVAIVPLVLSFLLLHALPLLPRRSRLFGVDVPPEIRYGSEGSRLMRGYQLWLLPFTVGALLILVLWTFRSAIVFGGVAVAAFAALWLLYQGHAQAVRFALPPPSIREASLSRDTGGLPLRLLWFAPPLVLLSATALYLSANWNRIPETFPIHFDLHGNPNGWSRRTVQGVFGLLILGALIVIFLMALYIVMDLGSRRATRRSVMLTALAGPTYLIGILFSLAGLLPLFVPPVWVFVVLVGVFLPVFAVLMARVLSQPSDGPPEITPDRCWHGSFYYNPDDPALFVEARTGFGYTANFARRLAWLLTAVVLLFTLGLIVLAPKLLSKP